MVWDRWLSASFYSLTYNMWNKYTFSCMGEKMAFKFAPVNRNDFFRENIVEIKLIDNYDGLHKINF